MMTINGTSGAAVSVLKISDVSNTPSYFALSNNAWFGVGLAAIGDQDGDAIVDIAGGAVDTGYFGAVIVMMLFANQSVKQSTRIYPGSNCPATFTLPASSGFGVEIGRGGDLDGDGIMEVAVGAAGFVHMLWMHSNGVMRTFLGMGSGFPMPSGFVATTQFGSSLNGGRDVDGDSVFDLLVGAYQDPAGGSERGAVFVLFL